jgi:hypothetical protein
MKTIYQMNLETLMNNLIFKNRDFETDTSPHRFESENKNVLITGDEFGCCEMINKNTNVRLCFNIVADLLPDHTVKNFI